jgi:hypothetical protein
LRSRAPRFPTGSTCPASAVHPRGLVGLRGWGGTGRGGAGFGGAGFGGGGFGGALFGAAVIGGVVFDGVAFRGAALGGVGVPLSARVGDRFSTSCSRVGLPRRWVGISSGCLSASANSVQLR